MANYGLIKDGILYTNSNQLNGYKPIIHAEIPDFNQTTHYVIQKAPIDNNDHIYIGVKIKELENADEGEGFEGDIF